MKKEQPNVDDPLIEVARKIRQKAQVLCFDEFQVILKLCFRCLGTYDKLFEASRF